jgi:hypothetical protein
MSKSREIADIPNDGIDGIDFLQAGVGAVVRNAQDKARETLSVTDFGATGDGVTDDGPAIIAAINAAIDSTKTIYNRAVYFPEGVYRVTTSGVLSSFTATLQVGALFYGDGKQSSIIMVDPPSTTDVWVYDNDTADKLQQVTFRDLGFLGKNATTGTPENSAGVYADINQYAKGFKINNSNASLHEGRFHFDDCWFGLLETAVQFSGAGVGSGGLSDECSFVACQFNQIRGPVLVYNNNQAIANNFVHCVFSRTYSDVIYLTGFGGGPSTFTGCSFIMTPDSATAPALSYIINTDQTGSGHSNTPFMFNGGVAECRGTYGAIMKGTGTGTMAAVFNGFRFLNDSAADKVVVTLNDKKNLKFNDCVFFNNTPAAHQLFQVGGTGVGNNGGIKFRDCFYPEERTAGTTVVKDLSDVCSITTNYGLIEALGTRGGNATTGAGIPGINSQDFSLGASTSLWLLGHTDPAINLKSIACKKSSLFPEISASVSESARESTVRLPKNAVIKNIYAVKNALGYTSAVTDFVMQVTNNNKTTVHAASTSARRDLLHSAIGENLFYSVGTTENERIIRLSCTGTGTDLTDQSAGFWIIEYY